MIALPDLGAIRSGGKPALARALAAIETTGGLSSMAGLLDRCLEAPTAQVIGLTGPPGVGKSTLVDVLIRRWRERGETVGVIAVDPSSRGSGGALLGDRTRLKTDPADPGVFVRSMAARDRLGGLSEHAAGAAALMGALFDRVIVETVGIGQSEADIATVADTVVLCVQPGSGDSLQFIKAGVMEIPDIVAVTKADIGAPARRAAADVAGALSLAVRRSGEEPSQVIALSATTGEGIDDLLAAIETRRGALADPSRRLSRQTAMLAEALRASHGRAGLSRVDVDAAIREFGGPFGALSALAADLDRRLDR